MQPWGAGFKGQGRGKMYLIQQTAVHVGSLTCSEHKRVTQAKQSSGGHRGEAMPGPWPALPAAALHRSNLLQFLGRDWVSLQGLPRFSRLTVKLSSFRDYRPLPPQLHFRKEIVKTRLLPFRAWEGAVAALCFIVVASKKGWKLRTFLLS